MPTGDGRNVLKANPPHEKGRRSVSAHLDPDDYTKIYELAQELGVSMNEAIRFSIRYTYSSTINR